MPVKAFKSINMLSFYFHWASVLIINEKELKTLKITIIGNILLRKYVRNTPHFLGNYFSKRRK